jgi:hypothetical protein
MGTAPVFCLSGAVCYFLFFNNILPDHSAPPLQENPASENARIAHNAEAATTIAGKK